jgi:hypothetical protein
LEPFLSCLDLMDQRFHPAINKSVKLILLNHAYKHTKMSANKLVLLEQENIFSLRYSPKRPSKGRFLAVWPNARSAIANGIEAKICWAEFSVVR